MYKRTDEKRNNGTRGAAVFKALRCAVFLCVLGIFLVLLGGILRERNYEYLSPEANELSGSGVEVLLLGPSTIMNGVYPLELYEKYGISAYNVGTGSQSLMASYFLLQDLLKKNTPKVVVLDCGKARSARAIVKLGYLHYVTDMLPIFNKERLEMIRISAEDRHFTFDETAGLLLPVLTYHARWEDLKKKDLKRDEKYITLGAKVDPRTWQVTEPYEIYEPDPEAVIPEIAEDYLRRIIALCDERGIELLLMTMPNMTPAVDVDQKEYELRIDAASVVDRIAEECGLTHLNLISEGESLGLIPGSDTADGQHLNDRGATKFTVWLGAYLEEHYALTDFREGNEAKNYDGKYAEFQDYVAKRVQQDG